MAVQFQLRRGLATQWVSVNPVLAQGEQGLELDTGRLKIGNGTDTWVSLAYSFESVSVDLTSIEGRITSVDSRVTSVNTVVNNLSSTTNASFVSLDTRVNAVSVASSLVSADLTSVKNVVSNNTSVNNAAHVSLQTAINVVSNQVSVNNVTNTNAIASVDSRVTSINATIRTNLVSLVDVSLATGPSTNGYAVTWNNTNSQFVLSSVGGASVTWGSITGSISNQTDLQTILDNKATLGTNVAFTSMNINGTSGNGHIHLRHQSATPSTTGSSSTFYADASGLPFWYVHAGTPEQLAYESTLTTNYVPYTGGTADLDLTGYTITADTGNFVSRLKLNGIDVALYGQNLSTFTNDVGYITSSALTPYLTISSAASTYFTITAAGGKVNNTGSNSLNARYIRQFTALTDAASISLDLNTNNFYRVVLGGNRTLANPTNKPTSGNRQVFILEVVQDGTGGRTLSFGTDYVLSVTPILNSPANAVTHLVLIATDTLIYVVGYA